MCKIWRKSTCWLARKNRRESFSKVCRPTFLHWVSFYFVSPWYVASLCIKNRRHLHRMPDSLLSFIAWLLSRRWCKKKCDWLTRVSRWLSEKKATRKKLHSPAKEKKNSIESSLISSIILVMAIGNRLSLVAFVMKIANWDGNEKKTTNSTIYFHFFYHDDVTSISRYFCFCIIMLEPTSDWDISDGDGQWIGIRKVMSKRRKHFRACSSEF